MASEKKVHYENIPVFKEKQQQSLSSRFEKPIIKVSLKEGVILNRIDSFWIEQTCHSREAASF